MSTNNQSVSDQDFVAISYVFDGEENVIPHLVVNDVEEEIDLSPLNPAEKKLLAECEQDIEERLGAASSVGYRLRIIKTGKLYREKYSSFEKYCQDEWGLSRFHATRLIKADQCISNLQKAHQIGAPVAIPTKESHARHVDDLAPDRQIKVARKVKETVGKGKQTAKDWEDAREELFPIKPASKPAEAKEAANPKVEETKIIPMPVQKPKSGMVLVQLPSEFYKVDCTIPTLQDLSKMASTLRNIKDNSLKRKEADKLARELATSLDLYAKWEHKFLNPTAEKETQAA